MSRRFIGAFLFLASSASFGQLMDPPVANWTVPPYGVASGGLTTMTDFTPPRVFVAVVPCRVVDTRNAVGPYGGPALATNGVRAFDIDNGPCAGLPAGIESYSLNFGGILAPADGFLTAWPTGSAQPLVSQLNLVAGKTVANAAIVPAGTNGSINVLVNIGPTHIYIDINGYFSDQLGTPANSLEIRNASFGPTLLVVNGASSCAGPCGVQVQTTNGHAISAVTTGSGVNYGVYGQVNSSAAGSAGVRALANSTSGVTYAVFGENNSSTSGSAGVFGRSDGSSGTVYGVLGSANPAVPNAADAAGVQGNHGTFNHGTNHWVPSGVRGDGQYAGVIGVSGDIAVFGIRIDSSGFVQHEGMLGTPTYGVYSAGDTGASGTKFFVEPHPTDASKVIRYAALEGPEAGTYFRGRGRFERGIARIEVPEDFRMVTADEDLTVQVTPIGAMASFAVLKADLNEILVQSSRNVEFYYLVQGVRATHRHLTPVGAGQEYMPRNADERIPMWLTEGQKRLLIQNGTYNPDGTVNLETARRVGWDRVWADREAKPAPEPSTP